MNATIAKITNHLSAASAGLMSLSASLMSAGHDGEDHPANAMADALFAAAEALEAECAFLAGLSLRE